MTYIKEFSFCIIISCLLARIDTALHSTFINQLITNLLGLVATIFSVNIATTGIIMQAIITLESDSEFRFEKSRIALKSDIVAQLILIGLSALCLTVYYSDLKFLTFKYPSIDFNLIFETSKVILISVFIYFLWITLDIAKSLFNVIKAKG